MSGDAASSGFLNQQLRDFADEVAELSAGGLESLTDTLAHWLAAHYVAAARKFAQEAGGEGIAFQTLRNLSADVVALRRGDHSAARLKMERERLALDRQEKIDAGLDAMRDEINARPEVRAAYGLFAKAIKEGGTTPLDEPGATP